MPEWYEDSDNVAVLVDYMAQTYPVSRESMEQIAYAVSKPWKHADVWKDACEWSAEMERVNIWTQPGRSGE